MAYKPYPQVVLFGDSLFQGCSQIQEGFSFQGALQHHCVRVFDVINRGLSGYNTKNALEVFPDMFLPPSSSNPSIEYLLVLLGANDACLPIPTCTQGVPIDQYKANLVKIITHDLIKAHNPKILLITPPPLDEIRTRKDDLKSDSHGQPCRKAAVNAEYSEVVRKVASEVPGVVVLVDLYEALMKRAVSLTKESNPSWHPSGRPPLGYPEGQRGGLEQLLTDGLHMSGEAYRVLFDLVKDHIKPDSKTPPFKDWREMNAPH
ncbi:Uu.00g060640.m01.CDS01 [Anthostomella pinea]|uniref:Uu.00g060640.m01.CDS01 n=1 Tax=Anthostomella pinea TaxID=933095 RepID=A0AAI8VSZ2_9PEZI|nr:Uu.00g060640.m01.CDS01 [Anthostomella pinea]